MNAAKEAFSEYLDENSLDQQADLFRKSDRGIHCAKWHDERSVGASGGTIYGSRKCRGHFYGSERMDGNSESDRPDQCKCRSSLGDK